MHRPAIREIRTWPGNPSVERFQTKSKKPRKDSLKKIILFLKILSTSISWHFLKLQNENPRWPMWKHPNCKWLTRTERTEPYPDPTQILFQLTKREIKDLCKSITEQQPDSDVPFYLIDLNDVQEKVWLIYYDSCKHLRLDCQMEPQSSSSSTILCR